MPVAFILAVNKLNDTTTVDDESIFIQTGRFINVISSAYHARAAIYNEEERQQIELLIRHNFLPHHTATAYGIRSSRNHWRLEKYRGRISSEINRDLAVSEHDTYGLN